MRVIFKDRILILAPENPGDELELAVWKEGREGHVLGVSLKGSGLALHDLGMREDVCNEPVQVQSRSADPRARLISNFAPTPFELDGIGYASVESFWQGLKLPTRRERLEMAELPGPQARRRGEEVGYGATISYNGETIPVGTWAHWQLMERACLAKFDQCQEAREALLATGTRPLVHRMRRDSKTIPGAIMADIWMRIRRSLQAQSPDAVAESAEDEEAMD